MSQRPEWTPLRELLLGLLFVEVLEQDERLYLQRTILMRRKVLADRVIIMSRGRVRCAGTSAHLRAHFGLGFTLTLSLVRGTTAEDASAAVMAKVPLSTVTYKSAPKLAAAMETDDGVTDQVVMHIPAEAAVHLGEFCDALDASSIHSRNATVTAPTSVAPALISVLNYSVGTLDLADIFMKVVAEETEETEHPFSQNFTAAALTFRR